MYFQIKTKVKVLESLCKQYFKLMINEFPYNKSYNINGFKNKNK